MQRVVAGGVVVPPNLEQVFLLRGPTVLRSLVDGCGGPVRAREISGAATATILRWLSEPPGRTFGPRAEMASYRSIWFGYPPPFPSLDRVVEIAIGPEESFIGCMVKVSPSGQVDPALRKLRRAGGFGLDTLLREIASRRSERGKGSRKGIAGLSWPDVDEELFRDAVRQVDAPVTTRQRWWRGQQYPRQWRTLDRLAAANGYQSWTEAVLAMDPSTVQSVAPDDALRCLARHLVSRTAIPR